METFYYSYKGNKRNEIKHIQNLLETHKDSYNKFVEAFGGTCAMSRYIYENYKDKEIYINDVNKDLTFFANNFHKCCDTVISHIKDVVKSINNEQEYKQYYKKANTEKDNETDLIERLVYILFINSCYRINKRHYWQHQVPKFIGLTKVKPKLNNFFKNNEYHCHSYIETFKKFENDEQALIYLDPPYFNTDTEDYSNNDKKLYSNMWEDIYNLFETSKCKIIMVVNDNFFMRKVFKRWYYNSYDKKYNSPKSKATIHNIFVKMN